MSGKEHKKLTNPDTYEFLLINLKKQQGLLLSYRHISTNNSMLWRVHLPSLASPLSPWPQLVTAAPSKHIAGSSKSPPLPIPGVNLHTHAKLCAAVVPVNFSSVTFWFTLCRVFCFTYFLKVNSDMCSIYRRCWSQPAAIQESSKAFA